MHPHLSIISNIALFQGIDASDIEKMLHSKDATIKTFLAGMTILHVGQSIEKFGIVLDGTAKICKESVYGDEYVLSELEAFDMFAESFAYATIEECPVNVVATSPCTILFLAVFQKSAKNDQIHQMLNQRMLHIFAEKNIALQNKNELLSQRTIRDKVLHYLEREASMKGTRQIQIPFDRKELADYICVDRASLSRELAQMQKEGLLSYRRNLFVLK